MQTLFDKHNKLITTRNELDNKITTFNKKLAQFIEKKQAIETQIEEVEAEICELQTRQNELANADGEDEQLYALFIEEINVIDTNHLIDDPDRELLYNVIDLTDNTAINPSIKRFVDLERVTNMIIDVLTNHSEFYFIDFKRTSSSPINTAFEQSYVATFEDKLTEFTFDVKI